MPDGSVIVDDVLIMEQLRLLQQDQPGILKDANATRQALQQLGLLPCMQPLPASYAAAAAAIPGKSAATGAERPKRSTAELDALLEKYHERLHSTSMPDGCYLGLREAVLGLPKLKSLGAFVHIDGELAGRIAQLTQLTQLDLQGCCVREAELCTMVKELTGRQETRVKSCKFLVWEKQKERKKERKKDRRKWRKERLLDEARLGAQEFYLCLWFGMSAFINEK